MITATSIRKAFKSSSEVLPHWVSSTSTLRRLITSSPVTEKINQTGSMLLNFERGVSPPTHESANTARRVSRVRKNLPGVMLQSLVSLHSLTRRPFTIFGEHHAAHHDPRVSVVPTRDGYLALQEAPAGVAH